MYSKNRAYIEDLYQYGTRILIKKDKYIYNANNPEDDHNAYFLDSGICALMSVTKSGEEKIYLYFKAKRTIGFSQIMVRDIHLHSTQNVFSIVAKTDCILYRISEETFHGLLEHDPKFIHFMLNVLSENYLDVLNRYHQTQEESATVRLCRLLLEYCQERDGRLILPKYFTCIELSKYLGTHTVTVSRIISKLKQYGYISKDGHSIVVEKPDQLHTLIDSGLDFEY